MRGTCEGCAATDRRVGPFRADDRHYTSLCGGCKIRITLQRPGVVERLRATARAAVAAADLALLDLEGKDPS